MPRKYTRKTPPETARPRDAKGRLLPADAKPEPEKAQPAPSPPLPPAPVALEMPTGERPIFPSPALYEQMRQMAVDIFESGARPVWMHKPEVILTVLLRCYELRIGAIQGLWNTYLGEDGRPLSTAELMRSQVLRSGVGYMQALRRDNEEVTYEGVRYGRRGDGSDDVKVTVTWKISDLTGGPLRGLPRQTLDARATSELSRTLFADVAGGYCPEDFDLPVRPVVETREPALAPEPVSEPPAAAAPAAVEPPAASVQPAAPPPAPEPAAAAPAAPAPSNVPGANEEVLPGRRLTRLVQVPTPEGIQPRWSAGISGDQVTRIVEIAGTKHQNAAQQWLGSKGLKRLSWCTEAEGDELIAHLLTLANGEQKPPAAKAKQPKPPPPLTFERAYGIFEKEITKIGLPVEKAASYVAQQAGMATIRDLLPEQILQAAEDFKAMAASDLNSFKIAFARLTEQEAIDPNREDPF